MKISGIDLYSTPFTSKKRDEKDVSLDFGKGDLKEESNSSKKVVYALSALAVVGIAALALRKGKSVSTHTEPIKPTIHTTPPADNTSEPVNALSKEAKDALDNVRKAFGQETKVSPEIIDSNILIATSEQNSDLAKLNKYFEEEGIKAEKLQAENLKLKNAIRKKLSNPTEPDAQLGNKIDNRTKTMPDDVRADMNEYYTQMAKEADEKALELKKIEEAKQAKKDAMLKLKEENPEEYHRLKVERNKAQRLAKKERKAKAIKTVPSYNDFHDGTVKIIPTANGNIEREYIDATGKLSSEVRYEKDRIVRTSYKDGVGKTSFIHDNKSGNTTMKHYEIDEKGKYRLVSREVDIPTKSTTITVEHKENGLTQITTESPASRSIVIKDNKGNIISSETIEKSRRPKKPDSPDVPMGELLAPWYKDYLRLCKMCHVSPRLCGVKGGAFDHYYELSLKVYDPDGYESYMRIRKYRIQYNEKAQILDLLEKLDKGVLRVPLSDSEILKIKKLIEAADFSDSTEKSLAKLIAETKAYRARMAAQRQRVVVYA